MELSVEERQGVHIVRVGGAKMTYPALRDFFERVRGVIEASDGHMIIDLQAVSYIDSASIGCLMDIHRLLQEKKACLRLSGLQSRVETMISMTGLHKIIELHRDEADAITAAGGGGQDE